MLIFVCEPSSNCCIFFKNILPSKMKLHACIGPTQSMPIIYMCVCSLGLVDGIALAFHQNLCFPVILTTITRSWCWRWYHI